MHFVAHDAPVKFFTLRLKNTSGRPRRLSVTGYVAWVLGDLRPAAAMHVITEIDPNSGALLARNAYHVAFADRVAFFDTDASIYSITADRTEFIGRNGALNDPAIMRRTRLSGRVGAGLDPCGAIQAPITLTDGQSGTMTFRLGVGRDPSETTQLIWRFRGPMATQNAREAVHRYWQLTLGKVQIHTPDLALNVLTNGWLIYQTLACRLWARSGYYQSGGAFGFRDQLQDAMALVHTEPQRLREQILLCASRQFVDGDVQHWWHPPTGRGVRTRCTDDYLWLPIATSRYLSLIGDSSILEAQVLFLEGRPVTLEEESYYDLPAHSEESASLYTHCVRALEHGLKFGPHGLPLMGTGDWNDGMNRVGAGGRGESVWLGFFLYEALNRFAPIALRQGDTQFALRCRTEAKQLQQQIHAHGWDGAWYRRAYFDDGTPMGSQHNAECQIDSIAQSWSVLSGAGDQERTQQAMDSLYTRLVRPTDRLVQLLDPPFNQTDLDPGYIRGYVPGVRENGGQYTHAAIWAAMAFAAQGDQARAWELQRMINPVNHGSDADRIRIYQVEPYVVAADVYAVAPHIGRGGWTWYTGSAGWMYRLILESLLGVNRQGDTLRIEPQMPPDWDRFSLDYHFGNTCYHIGVTPTRTSPALHIDGIAQTILTIPLVDDQCDHHVEITVRIP